MPSYWCSSAENLLQKTLEENIRWIVSHVPSTTQLVKGLKWTDAIHSSENILCSGSNQILPLGVVPVTLPLECRLIIDFQCVVKRIGRIRTVAAQWLHPLHWKHCAILSYCTQTEVSLVSLCIESSQPQKIISGLKTNFSLFPSYSIHRS